MNVTRSKKDLQNVKKHEESIDNSSAVNKRCMSRRRKGLMVHKYENVRGHFIKEL